LLVVPGDSYQVLLLGGGNGFFRIAEVEASFGSHLDEDEAVPVPSDDINLAVGTPVVGFQDAVAATDKEIAGYFLSQDTSLPAFQGSASSLTGLNEWRWIGHGPL
jgi:hypothetical protein